MANKNVPKRKPQTKRSNRPGDDPDRGLWVDNDLLRKHQRRQPEILRHAPTREANHRYLELADLALGNKKPKKKSKATAEAKGH